MPRKWYGLVVHHTAGKQTDTVESVRKYHKAHGYADIGYHYFFEIDTKGRFHLKAGRSTELQGCHGDRQANKNMLGVCIPGNYDRDRLTEDQYQEVLGGIIHLLQKHEIAPDKLVGHYNIKATDCPGRLFPLNALKADVKDRMP